MSTNPPRLRHRAAARRPPFERAVMSNAHAPVLALALALPCALALRVVDLERVPAWYTDEGLWSMPARDFVLTGNWFANFDSHYLLGPLYSAVLAVWFALLSPGIPQARALNVLLGVGT